MKQGIHFYGSWAMYSFRKIFLTHPVNDMQQYIALIIEVYNTEVAIEFRVFKMFCCLQVV